MISKADRARIIELAEKMVRSGRLSEAIVEYKKLLEGEEPDSSIGNIVGDLYARLGQTEEAIRTFQGVSSRFEERGQYIQVVAIYKKIQKLAPERVEFMIKLGDMFALQGYSSEAKREYLKAEAILKSERKTREMIAVYEKMAGLDKEDLLLRTTLAELYVKNDQIDQAVELLNNVAEVKIARNDLEGASKLLNRVQSIQGGNERALINLIEILRKLDRRQEAIRHIKEFLSYHSDNLQFMTLLGTMLFEESRYTEAEDCFQQIIAAYPQDVKARVTLGRIYVLDEELDKAYELYDPLITSLLKKQKDDKAIGLLGIILSAKKMHLPSLDRLASIYKARNEIESLEIVYRVLLEEARAKHLKDRMIAVLTELGEFYPNDTSIAAELVRLKKETAVAPEIKEEKEVKEVRPVKEVQEAKEIKEVKEVRPVKEVKEAKEVKEVKEVRPVKQVKLVKEVEPPPKPKIREGDEEIQETIDKANLYIKQGLVRNAKRMLENMSLLFPDDERIQAKLAEIEKSQTQITDDELLKRVEKVAGFESKTKTKSFPTKSIDDLFKEDLNSGEKVTSADIFAGTDLLPLQTDETDHKIYYDLGRKVDEELDVIHALYDQQMRTQRPSFEKDLADIVSEFTTQAKHKIDFEDYDTHYQLGLAFLEQGLVDEAIEEFIKAAQDDNRAFECCTLIAHAYRQKKDYDEAARWFEKCLETSESGSEQEYALDYELGTLYELMGENKKALGLFEKVMAWNANYRDVNGRIRALLR